MFSSGVNKSPVLCGTVKEKKRGIAPFFNHKDIEPWFTQNPVKNYMKKSEITWAFSYLTFAWTTDFFLPYKTK